MGNNKSTTNIPEAYSSQNDASMLTVFNSVQSFFVNFDLMISDTRNIVESKHNTLKNKLMQKLGSPDYYYKDILRKRDELIKKLNKTKRYSYTRLRIYFKENTRSLYEILLNEFYFINRNFELINKVKYLHLFNQFEEINTDFLADNCYNYLVIPFSRNKIFYCLAVFEKKSFMKITDRNGNELYRSSIDKNNYYRQFMVYGDYLVGLFDDVHNEHNIIEIYNDKLVKISSRSFKIKMELWSFDQNEVITRSLNSCDYYFIDYNLDTKLIINLEKIIIDSGLKLAPGQSTLNNNSIVVLGANKNEIYLFYTITKHIKRINRSNGEMMGFINLENTFIKSYWNLKLDQNTNFLLKTNPSNSVMYFDKDGQYLIENECDNLKYFKMFELLKDNDIYYFDHPKRKICFL